MLLFKRVSTVLFFSIFLVSCSKDDNPVVNEQPQGYQYTVPEQTNDGWETASVVSVGINVTPLVDMVNFIDTTQNHQIHNILIFKNKKLVFEKYFTASNYSISPPALGSTIISYNKDMNHW